MPKKTPGKRRRSVTKRPWGSDHTPSPHGREALLELTSIKHADDIQHMAASQPLLIFTAHCGECPMRVLLDSGAQSNFISATAVKRAGLCVRPLRTPLYVRHSNGVEMTVTTEAPNVELVFQQCSTGVSCIEVPSLNYDVILGQPWHRQTNPQINWTTQQVFVNRVSLESKLVCPHPRRETVSTA